MNFIVYFLCCFTSLACVILLIRGYLRKRMRILFWSGVFFTGLAANNALLLYDSLTAGTELSLLRSLITLISGLILINGFIWETA